MPGLKFPLVLFTKSNMIWNDSSVWSQQSQNKPSSIPLVRLEFYFKLVGCEFSIWLVQLFAALLLFVAISLQQIAEHIIKTLDYIYFLSTLFKKKQTLKQ